MIRYESKDTGAEILTTIIQLFPVLQSLGAGSLIAPAGNCSDNAQVCPSQNYCFKRIGWYSSLSFSFCFSADTV